MIVVLLGPPGSGKGTQADALVKRFGLSHLSTGQLLRDAILDNSDIGRSAKSYMDSGNLVPDSIVNELVSLFLKKNKNILLDGFPRNLAQAETLESLLAESNLKLDFVILLEVPRESLLQRLLLRARGDDTPTTITHRLSVFHEATQPLVNYYRNKGNLKIVDGNASVSDVEKAIQDIVDGVCA